MVSGGDDKTLTVWDLRTGAAIKQFEVGDAITSIEISADGCVLFFLWLLFAATTGVVFWREKQVHTYGGLPC